MLFNSPGLCICPYLQTNNFHDIRFIIFHQTVVYQFVNTDFEPNISEEFYGEIYINSLNIKLLLK